MIIGTAGHVDHGKTALVKGLTGVDTDRLEEEKRRGISIDLGFAYLRMADGTRLGFVDVPGHERFIRTMVAGISGIDCVMIVVAANEGPRPQTHEHLLALELLGVSRACAVITKTDLVPEQCVAKLSVELKELLAVHGMAAAPVLPVSTLTGGGLEQLRAWLCAEAQKVGSQTRGTGFRMPIDRYFTLPGHGPVVTGTVWAGRAEVEDHLIIAPSALPVRVRRIHANGERAVTGRAGQRCAFNVVGPDLSADRASRGNWLVGQDLNAPTTELDARLKLARQSGPERITNWSSTYLHVGTTAAMARVALLDGGDLERGGEGLARFVAEAPFVALHGDRFLISDPSSRRIIGGGTILDPFPPSTRRRKRERVTVLRALELTPTRERLQALLFARREGVDLDWFRLIHNLDGEQAEAIFREVPVVRANSPAWGFHPSHFDELSQAAVGWVAKYFEERPEETGVAPDGLRRELGICKEAHTALLDRLIAGGRLVSLGGLISVPYRSPALTANDQAILRHLMKLSIRSLEPVTVLSIAQALGLADSEVRASMRRLSYRKHVVFVHQNRVLATAALRCVAVHAERAAAKSTNGLLTIEMFRAAAGVGRNGAIMLLEHLDRAGFTRRVDAGRKVLRPAATAFPEPTPRSEVSEQASRT